MPLIPMVRLPWPLHRVLLCQVSVDVAAAIQCASSSVDVVFRLWCLLRRRRLHHEMGLPMDTQSLCTACLPPWRQKVVFLCRSSSSQVVMLLEGSLPVLPPPELCSTGFVTSTAAMHLLPPCLARHGCRLGLAAPPPHPPTCRRSRFRGVWRWESTFYLTVEGSVATVGVAGYCQR